MPVNKVYKGSIGTRIRLEVFTSADAEDMSGGSNFKIYYQKPDGTSGVWTAVLDATTDKHLYFDTTLATDLDQKGTWKLQSYHEKSGWKGRGATADLPVYDVFE